MVDLKNNFIRLHGNNLRISSFNTGLYSDPGTIGALECSTELQVDDYYGDEILL